MVFENKITRCVLDCARRTSGDTEKWITPFDSAHQIGPLTFSTEVLTADEEVRGC